MRENGSFCFLKTGQERCQALKGKARFVQSKRSYQARDERKHREKLEEDTEAKNKNNKEHQQQQETGS